MSAAETEEAFDTVEPASGVRLIERPAPARPPMPGMSEAPQMRIASDAGSALGYEILGPGHVGFATFLCVLDACDVFHAAVESGELAGGCIVSCPSRIVLMHTGRRADFASRARAATLRPQRNERAPRAVKLPDWMSDRTLLPLKPPGRT